MLPSIATEEQNVGINSQWKTPEQYTIELQNMKDHGVLYPTIEQGYDNWSPFIQSLNLALSLRKQTGLPTDHIYVLNFGNMQIDKSTQKINLTKLEQDVNNWKTITSQNGFGDVYIYGIDEASGDVLRVRKTGMSDSSYNRSESVCGTGSDNRRSQYCWRSFRCRSCCRSSKYNTGCTMA